MTIPGRATVSGEFHGIDEAIGACQRLRRLSGETISVEPQLVVTAEHEGRSLDVLNAYAFHLRDGKLAEGRLCPGDLHAIEAFFS